MSTIRVEKTSDYTIMSNYHLKEKQMSLKAKGLLSLMLSLPDDWDYSIAGLVSICKENETSIKSTLNELKEFGYLKVNKLLPNQTISGRIEYDYIVYEKKQEGEKQDLENLGVEVQGIENPVQLNTNTTIIKEENTNNIIKKENIKRNDVCQEIFDYYVLEKKIYPHKSLTDKMEKAIKNALKEYSAEDIKRYIDRYSTILNDDKYYYNHRWEINKFLSQSNGISNFTDDGSKWVNYNNTIKQKQPTKTEDEEYAERTAERLLKMMGKK